jgi:hypothetical protein
MKFGAGGLEDLSFFQGAFTLSLLLTGALVTLNIFRRKRPPIPRRHSLIPHAGSGATYFAGVVPFVVENKERFGEPFPPLFSVKSGSFFTIKKI